MEPRVLATCGAVLFLVSRSNIQPDQADMTADSSLIGKLMDDLMPAINADKPAKGVPSIGADGMENPGQILKSRLSHHRRRSDAGSRRQSTAEDDGEAAGGASTGGSGTPAAIKQAGSADAATRRLTVDASELDQFFRDMLMSPKARTTRASMAGGRRETADPDALRQLIAELRSPGANKATLDRVLQELGCSPSDNPDWSRLTVDPAMLGRLTDDLDSIIAEELQEPSVSQAMPRSPAPSAIRREEAPSSAGRRLTADPCSLASLGLIDMDVSIGSPSGRRQSQRGSSSGSKKAKTPPQQSRRRDTASPGVLAELLGELDAGTGGYGAEEGPRASGDEGGRGEQASTERASAKKSPRRAAGAVASTPSFSRAAEEATAPQSVAEASSGIAPEFSMSPPRPAPASARRPLRSCLSSKRKTRPDPSSPSASATKKSVVFGSPDAALFFKNSPSNSLTPMTKRDVKRHFPSLLGVEEDEQMLGEQQQHEEPEEGVTAQNSAILAAWDADDASDDEAEEEPRSSTSSSKRKRTSRSPRPKRRQSLLIQSGSSKGYGIRDDDDEEEEQQQTQEPDRRASLSRRLSDRMVEGEDDGAVPMDVSPDGGSMDDMPDIGQRSPSFRSRDERTSAELGKRVVHLLALVPSFSPAGMADSMLLCSPQASWA